MPRAETFAARSCAARAPRIFPWRLLLGATTILGLASSLRIYVTYNALGVDLSLFDGIGSGLMDWLLWIPLAPLAFWLAQRFDTERGDVWRNLALHAVASVAASFTQLTLFALLSSVVRSLRFGDAWRVDLTSPLLMKLVPGIAVYWILVVGWWWRASRTRLAQTADGTGTGAAAGRGESDPVLVFQAGRGTLRVRAGEVDWVDSARNYVELHAGGSTHRVRETLQRAHQKLGTRRFLRIRRTTLVRREAIVELHPAGPRPAVVLRDGTRLDVGRSFRRALDDLDVVAERVGLHP